MPEIFAISVCLLFLNNYWTLPDHVSNETKSKWQTAIKEIFTINLIVLIAIRFELHDQCRKITILGETGEFLNRKISNPRPTI